MIVHCERCETRFELNDAGLAGGSLRARCAHCNHVFQLDSPKPEEEGGLEGAGTDAQELNSPANREDPDAREQEVELGSEDDWEFAEPSNVTEEAGESEPGENLESFSEVLDVMPPTLEPLEQGECLAPLDRVEADPGCEVSADASMADFGMEEIDGALSGLSAWEPEGEDSEQPVPDPPDVASAPVPKQARPVPVPFEPSEVVGREAPMRWPRLSQAGSPFGWLAVLFLVIVGLHRGVAVEPQPGTRPLPVAMLGDHRLSEIDTRWVDNLQAGPLLVVSGRLRGVGSLPLEALELTLLDAQGVELAGAAAPLGPALSRETLRFSSPQEIRREQIALRGEWSEIPSGKARRFDAVFSDVPGSAASVRVGRAVESAGLGAPVKSGLRWASRPDRPSG